MNRLETTIAHIKGRLKLTSASPLVGSVRPAYDFLLHNFYGRRGLIRVINGEDAIRVRPSYRNIREDYEPALYKHLRHNLRPGATVLDIGAHVGQFSILMARWTGPRGRVYAFEPAPRTRSALEDHLALNGVSERVSVIPIAVSDRCGITEFYVSASSPENTLSRKHRRIPQAKVIRVETTTIDAFCIERYLRPDLIKMDIEGFEFHALNGARQTLLCYRPEVVVEIHPMNWPEIGINRSDVAALISSLGYSAVGLEDQEDPLGEYGHVILRRSGDEISLSTTATS
jgi:FkbM family methyltransferase